MMILLVVIWCLDRIFLFYCFYGYGDKNKIKMENFFYYKVKMIDIVNFFLILINKFFV